MKTRPLAAQFARYFFAALLLLNLGFVNLAEAAEPQIVPMQQILADPQQFEGQRVRVTGFLRLEFEANALYLDRNDFNNSVIPHSLWLDLKDAQLRSLSKLNNGRVIVEGVFIAKGKGHAGMWPGSLTDGVHVHMWRIHRRK